MQPHQLGVQEICAQLNTADKADDHARANTGLVSLSRECSRPISKLLATNCIFAKANEIIHILFGPLETMKVVSKLVLAGHSTIHEIHSFVLLVDYRVADRDNITFSLF